MNKEWGKYHFEYNSSDEDVIREVVEMDIEPLINQDSQEDIDFFRKEMTDYRLREYELLMGIGMVYQPKLVLYVGSGADPIPKFIFGSEKVVHTSLEKRRGDKMEYFPDLGSGLNVISDNKPVPFAQKSFEAILILDSQQIITGEFDQYVDLLKADSVIAVLENDLFINDDNRIQLLEKYKNLQRINSADGIGLFEKI